MIKDGVYSFIVDRTVAVNVKYTVLYGADDELANYSINAMTTAGAKVYSNTLISRPAKSEEDLVDTVVNALKCLLTTKEKFVTTTEFKDVSTYDKSLCKT